jgi:hypothetical protein
MIKMLKAILSNWLVPKADYNDLQVTKDTIVALCVVQDVDPEALAQTLARKMETRRFFLERFIRAMEEEEKKLRQEARSMGML